MTPENPSSDQPEEILTIEVRKAKPEDTNFISASWLKGIFKGSYFAKRVPHETFYEYHRPIVHRAFAKSNIYVAHPAGDPDTILGYLVLDAQLFQSWRPVIHWAYTRLQWRRVGVSRALFKAAGIDPNICVFTTWSFDCDPLVKRFHGLSYNPYL